MVWLRETVGLLAYVCTLCITQSGLKLREVVHFPQPVIQKIAVNRLGNWLNCTTVIISVTIIISL